MAHENLRCVVMSADMVPVSIIRSLDALVLSFKDRVYILEEHDGVRYRTVNQDFPAPAVVCHKRYRNLPNYYYVTAPLNLDTLKVRDEHTCQYCGRGYHELEQGEIWTRDHIFPRSRGGEDVWENVALSCSTCNNSKSDRTPEEAGMTLKRQPTKPTRWHIELLRGSNRHAKA